MCHDHDWLRIAEAEGEPAVEAGADESPDVEAEPATEERPTVDEEPALVPPADD